MKQDRLIKEISKSLKLIIGKDLGFNQSHRFHYTINGEFKAINRFDSPQKQVNVLNWFDDFWLFLEIKFENNDMEETGKNTGISGNKLNTFISLSVFQGDASDTEKYQLFRAEWDDYNNPEEKYAQPHWHITSSQAVENILKIYADALNQQDILRELENEKKKVIDVKKIHFAMNGDWQNNGTHIHKMENERQIARWLQGMLDHIRTELMRFIS